jgi:hypothetical protein
MNTPPDAFALALRGAQHVRECHVVRRQPRRIDQHLVLAHLAAQRHDLRHARHREQAPSHGPVGDGAHVHLRCLVARHGDEHDLAHDRRDRREHRRPRAGGSAAPRAAASR